MAESLVSSRRFVSRESKILVNVDHASDDLLVVSYPFKTKLFQGILIDSTNRYLPCAYPSPDVVKWSPPRVTEENSEAPRESDRPFYSLSNRFTYFQDVLFQKNVALVKTAKQARARAQKMTVRLRPRQVLCSKCRSICNENSENVDSSKKDSKPDKNGKNLLTECTTLDNQNEIKSPRKKVRTTLVTKLSRLEPEEVNGNRLEGTRAWSEMLEADKQMVLRKKRSVGSMEDLWDETVFEEAAKKAKTTPIIKISFGSSGEGTIVKIPSKVQLSESEGDGDDGEEEEEEEEERDHTEPSKSLKKAMKKAKKEAKRKLSPEREEEVSPEEPNYKKHKHRVKHKKRHKNPKEEEMKDKCLKQKLSISLRRVCGPGEEESWSGESSRSSEALREPEDTRVETVKGKPTEEAPPPDTAIVQPSRRGRRKAGFQKRKKQEASHDTLSEKPTPVHSQSVLYSNLSVHPSESFKPHLEPAHLKKDAQISDVPDRELDLLDVKAVRSAHDRLSSPDKIPLNLDESDCFGKTQESLPLKKSTEHMPYVQASKRKIVDQGSSEYDAISPPELTKVQNDMYVPIKLDDTLDDTLISEDSMPELDETTEDALLESDKEMPESLENQRDIALRISSINDNWETEPEIPVLTRMVDPEDLIPDKSLNESSLEMTRSVISPKSGSASLKRVNRIEDPSNLSLPSDEIRLSQAKEEISHDAQRSGCTPKPKTTPLNDQVVEAPNELCDSSEECEFLPAQDSFDCELPQGASTDSSFVPPLVPSYPSTPVKPLRYSDKNITPSTQDFKDNRLEGGSLSSSVKTDVSRSIEDKTIDDVGCDEKSSKPIHRPRDKTNLVDAVGSSLVSNDPYCTNISSAPPLDAKSILQGNRSDSLHFGPFSSKVKHQDSLAKDSVDAIDTSPSLPTLEVNAGVAVRWSPSRLNLKSPEGMWETEPDSPLDSVPNFPAESSPQGTHHEMTSCQAEDGSILTVGDIVWAKIPGFPWWPAKVVRLCASRFGNSGCDARVAWFGSAASSLMSTDQLSPFIQTFKAKYNRERKSTGYLEAIRQATSEASSRTYHLLPSPLADIDKLLAL